MIDIKPDSLALVVYRAETRRAFLYSAVQKSALADSLERIGKADPDLKCRGDDQTKPDNRGATVSGYRSSGGL